MAYLPLSTANLPDPAIDPAQGSSPSDYFNTVLYTGDGTSSRDITGVGFDPDFVWVKSRSNAYNHFVSDIVRGNNANLLTDSTSAEANPSTDFGNGGVYGVTTDGFSLTAGTTNSNNVNQSSATYVAWNWKANGSGVSNTVGSIPSTVSANTTSGFSIVSYSGNSTSGATIGHGLDSAPEMVVIRPRDAVNNWVVGHKDLSGWNYAVFLNLTNAQDTKLGMFNSTAPTSSVITLGNDSNVNQSNDYICYAFHSVDGFSKFGSYTGNGSTDGPFVYTGFRPAFVMVKHTTAVQDWYIFDAQRPDYNPANLKLYANQTFVENGGAGGGESTSTNNIDLLSNGFKCVTGNAATNNSTAKFIYMAFAENPFKYSLAR